MSVEGGFVVLDVAEVSIRLKEPPEEDVMLRLDASIVGADEELGWASNGGERLFSTLDLASFKKEVELPASEPVEIPAAEEGEGEGEAPAEGEGESEEKAAPIAPADYIVGFESTLRSSYVDLNNLAIGKLCNTNVVVKIYSVKQPEEEGGEKTEECLLSFTVSLGDLLLAKGTTLNTLGTVSLLAEQDNVDADASSVALRMACDNDLAEYVSGGNLISWGSVTLNSMPGDWGLHFEVEADPKAKADPTPEEDRAKWIDGIKGKAGAAAEHADYSITLSEFAGGVFQSFTLTEGQLTFDAERAAVVPLEKDIAKEGGLWSVSWEAPPMVFLHRRQVRQLATVLAAGAEAPQLEFVVTKTPTDAGAEAEGESMTGSAAADVTSLLTPGLTEVSLTSGFATAGAAESEAADGEATTGADDAAAEDEGVAASAEPEMEAAAAAAAEEGGDPEETPAPVEPTAPPSVATSATLRAPLVPAKSPTAPASSSFNVPPSSGRRVTETGAKRDVMREFRDEVTDMALRIAQEYIAMFPLAPEDDTADEKKLEERKSQFLYQISSSGIYHVVKEKIKPKVQRIVRERFGARGRAAGMVPGAPADGFRSALDAQSAADQLLSDVYIYLVKECNAVLNAMYRGTLVTQQTMEQEGKAFLDDEAESPVNALSRLHEEADNAESDGRAGAADQLHLERIQTMLHEPTLGSNGHLAHDTYIDYAEFLLRQAALKLGDAGASERETLLAKAREVVEVAITKEQDQWRSHLLLGAILAEAGQQERAEELFVSSLALQLDDKPGKGGLESAHSIDGYDSDKLCPAHPLCYGVMAAFYKLQRLPLRARKALRMGSRSWGEMGCSPKVSEHGKPRKTTVLLMSDAALYLLERGLTVMGSVCVDIASESDAAASAKAIARDLAPDTVPHLRHQLHRAKARRQLAQLDYSPALESARMSVLSVTGMGEDEVLGWLAVATVQVAAGWPTDDIADTYRQAIASGKEAMEAGLSKATIVPLEAYLSLAKILLGRGAFDEALSVAVECCTVYPHASSAYLVAGVCCLRLDRPEDAEDALQEANLLDNRNPEVWAFLSLLALKLGPQRDEEAAASLQQALRLNLGNSALLRELATAYVAVDRLTVAEDLVRRAISVEVAASPNNRASAFARKVLADVLAGQNQAAAAVESYKEIIADEDADNIVRAEAGAAAVSLLQTLGRVEEMYQLSAIVNSIRSS